MGGLMLNLLLDTNVLISAYPENLGSVEPLTKLATELISLANEHGHTTYSHSDAIELDTRNVRDARDRQWRRMLLEKHPKLPAHPSIPSVISETLGSPQLGSHDWVDHALLAAVVGDAVHILVTEDRGILQKAKRLDLTDRVVDIEDAIGIIKALAPRMTSPLLMASQTQAQVLDEKVPFFDSLRQDYPGFDTWLSKCKREHRTCWIIKDGSELAAATIVKDETPAEYGIAGRTLKIAMFKVSESFPGLRYGELLLKSVFDYIAINSFESAYVTVLPKHDKVIEFFESFGFKAVDERTPLGEIVLSKPFAHPSWGEGTSLLPLDYHIRYGPMDYRVDVSTYIVPIRPMYHRTLFPELEVERQFSAMQTLRPFGNSIKKAYLSRSNRRISPGSVLYFYRSEDAKALTLVGIVEDSRFSKNSDAIASYVWKRTVYSYEEIERMTSGTKRGVLAVRFRQARSIQPPITDTDLVSAGIWTIPPQSIMRLTSGHHKKWIHARVTQ